MREMVQKWEVPTKEKNISTKSSPTKNIFPNHNQITNHFFPQKSRKKTQLTHSLTLHTLQVGCKSLGKVREIRVPGVRFFVLVFGFQILGIWGYLMGFFKMLIFG